MKEYVGRGNFEVLHQRHLLRQDPVVAFISLAVHEHLRYREQSAHADPASECEKRQIVNPRPVGKIDQQNIVLLAIDSSHIGVREEKGLEFTGFVMMDVAIEAPSGTKKILTRSVFV